MKIKIVLCERNWIKALLWLTQYQLKQHDSKVQTLKFQRLNNLKLSNIQDENRSHTLFVSEDPPLLRNIHIVKI